MEPGLSSRMPVRSRPSSAVFLCALVAAAILWPRGTAAQVTVPDEAACPRCSIAVETLVTLGDADGPGALSGMPSAVAVDGRGGFWVLPIPGAPIVFGPDGRFVRVVGRQGSGPGEFSNPVDAVAVPGDSVLIVDRVGSRATVVGPDLRPARQVSLPFALAPSIAIRWPDMVMTGLLPTPEGAGQPLHLISLGASSGVVRSSFGRGLGEFRPGDEPLLWQRIAPSREGFWSADVIRYRVRRWSPEGVPAATLHRQPSWFPDASRPPWMGNRRTPPPPLLVGIDEDSAGRLWVFVRVPAARWERAWDRVPSAATEVPSHLIAVEELYDTRVELLDPRQGRLVAGATLSGCAITALAGGRLAVYSVDEVGIPRIRVLRVRLVGA